MGSHVGVVVQGVELSSATFPRLLAGMWIGSGAAGHGLASILDAESSFTR